MSIINNQLFDFGMAMNDISSYIQPATAHKLQNFEKKTLDFFK